MQCLDFIRWMISNSIKFSSRFLCSVDFRLTRNMKHRDDTIYAYWEISHAVWIINSPPSFLLRYKKQSLVSQIGYLPSEEELEGEASFLIR